jgi:hypothetical protein
MFLDSAAPTAWGILAASRFVAVVLAPTSKVDNVTDIVGANRRAHIARLMYPCFFCHGVIAYFVAWADRLACDSVPPVILCKHCFNHGSTFQNRDYFARELIGALGARAMSAKADNKITIGSAAPGVKIATVLAR